MAQTNVQAFSGDVEISSNLAVGITNPTSRLQITQDFGGSGPGVPLANVVANDGGLQFGIHVGEKTADPFSRTPLRVVDDGQTVLMVDGWNKRVGIGKTVPVAPLHVVAPAGQSSLWVEGPSNPGITFYNTEGGAGNEKSAQINYKHGNRGDTDNALQFFNVNASGTNKAFNFLVSDASEALTILNNKHVGIGTNNPLGRFNLVNQHNSNNCFNSLSLNTNNSYYSYINQRALNFSGDPLIEVKTAEYQEGQASTGPSFQVTGREGTPILCVKQNAQVGIGTNSNGRLRVKTQGCNVGGGPDQSQFSVSQYTSGSSLHLFAGTPGPDDHTGEARLWSLRPGLAWTQIALQGSNFAFYPVGGGMYFNGQVIHSDDRIKSDEEYIDNALSTIMKLKPQKYKKDPFLPNDPMKEVTENMTEMPDDIRRQEAGLMVQDVWYDAPELRYILKLSDDAQPTDTKPPEPVPGDPRVDPDYTTWGTKMSALDYNSVFVYNIKATQELKIEVDELESQITSILTRLDALEAS
jgi:hypothetical protein